MIKRYIPIAFMGLGLMGLTTGCNTMDTEPFESYSEDLVWGSAETAEAFVTDTYADVFGEFTASSAKWESRTPNGALCDQVYEGISGFASELGLDATSQDGGFGRFGTQRRCNLIMKKVSESKTLTDAKKAQLTAEAHFLRGMLYFDMTRKMGRFVPIKEVLTQDDKEAFKTPLTNDIAESYKLVMEDFDAALQGGLPETSDKSRINVYTVYALRSRAALQAYAYTKDAKYIDIAIESANKVINSNNYQLTAEYGSLFNNVSPADPEIIMARYYSGSDTTIGWFDEMIRAIPNLSIDEHNKGSKDGKGTLRPNKTFNGWAIYFPTQDLVDQYLAIDEKTKEAKVWYETSQIVDNVEFLATDGLTEGSVEDFTRFDGEKRHIPTKVDLITGKDGLLAEYPNVKFNLKVKAGDRNITELMYSNRDKRMDHTILRDDVEWCKEYMGMNMGGSCSQGIRIKEDGGWYTTTTGYYWKKHLVPVEPQMESGAKLDCHFVIARLGEMYMNLAEAYLLKNDVAKAVAALNKTRVQHGGLPASTAATIEDAWTDYMRERRVEMAYEEGDIYFSYLRWGKYGGLSNHGRAAGDVIKDLDVPVYKISITSDRQGALINRLNLLNSWNRNFTVKRYLLPIPQSEIDKRAAGGINDQQNPNW